MKFLDFTVVDLTVSAISLTGTVLTFDFTLWIKLIALSLYQILFFLLIY